MSEGHANFGCFHCKSTLHKRWECPNVAPGSSSADSRKEVQAEFLKVHPEVKRSQNHQRSEKYFKKLEDASKHSNTPWNEMMKLMESKIQIFMEIQFRLRRIPVTNFHSLDGGSKVIYEETLELQNQMRAELEESRGLIKAAKNRERQLQLVEKRKCEEITSQLQKTQHSVWNEVTSLTVSRRNIFKTVEDLNLAITSSRNFTRGLLEFINGHPEKVNYPKYQEQYIEIYQGFLKAKGWSEYLNTRTPLRLQTKDALMEAENYLKIAKNVIDGFESGEVYCLSCKVSAAVHRLACNHGYCNNCKNALQECIRCGSKDIHSTVRI